MGTEGLSDAIRQVRKGAGLTQEQLADRLVERSQHSVSQWETGVATPTLDTIRAVEEACGIPAGTVLRLAGYCADVITTTDAIAADPTLDALGKRMLQAAYAAARTE